MAADSEVKIAWINFTKSVQILLVPQADDRPLDQYLAFRDSVLHMVQDDEFLGDLDKAWSSSLSNEPQRRNALLQELQAFSRAVEVAKATEKPKDEKRWWKKMLGRASTVSSSVKDLVEALPPAAKATLTLLGELIDLFKA